MMMFGRQTKLVTSPSVARFSANRKYGFERSYVTTGRHAVAAARYRGLDDGAPAVVVGGGADLNGGQRFAKPQ